MRLKLGVAVATIVTTFASLAFTALPAAAVNYASVTASDSMATRTDITVGAQLGAPAYSTRQYYWATNVHGGIFEYGTNPVNNMQMVIRSFSNGVLDTSFNTTGSANVTMQIPAADRESVELSTYANGTKWMMLEINGYANSGLNYLHYGTYSGGYTGTLTLPTGSTYYGSYCTSRPSGGNFTRLAGFVSLLKDSGFTVPTLVMNCGAIDNNIAGASQQNYQYLVQLNGGTTLGTSGTWNVISGQMTPSTDSTNKSFVLMGTSVNPSASATTDIAVTSVYLRLSTATQPTWYESGDTNSWTDMVIMRSTVAGTTTSSGSVAYAPATIGSRNGTLAVPPRNNGTVYAYQHTTDWSTQAGKILRLGTTGGSGIAATTSTTGTGPKEHIGLASDQSPGTMLKVLIPSGGDKKYWEVNATTGAVTVGGTFSGTMASYQSLYWAPASDTNGVSYYARTGATTLTRMSLTTTPPTPLAPSAPTAPTGTAGAGQVALSWSAPNANNSAISDYEIDYSSNAGSSWDTFTDTVSATTSATVTGLANGTAYLFRIRAVNGIGTSSSSPASTSVTPIAVAGAPTNVVGNFGNAQAAISWTAPSSNNGSAITDYTIQYSSNGGTSWSTFAHTASTATSATVTGLTNGTSYTFKVAAVNGVGTSAYSSVSSAIIPATMPATISGIPGAQAGDQAVTVSWTAPAANGCAITDYDVEVTSDNGANYSTFTHSPSTATSQTVTGLTNGTTYRFRVAATNCAGTSAFSLLSGAVVPNPVPSQTSGLTVSTTGMSNELALAWTAPNNNGSAITDYLIQYSTDGGQTWQTYADAISTATNLTLIGLTNGASYSFRVSAISAIGTGLASTSSTSVVAVALPGSIAAAPTAIASPGQIVLNWSAPSSNGGAAITDYTIEYSTNGGSTWQTYSDGVSASTTATLTGLTSGASYTFKISATNSLGSGTASTVSTAAIAQPATAPAAITQITPTAGTNPGEVVLTWTAPAANGSAITDYVVEYSLDGGVTWVTFTDGTSASTTATITGLTVGTSYVFRVTAINGVGTATAGTASAPQAPATQVVVNSVSSNGSSSATVNPRQIPAEVTFTAQRSIPVGGTMSITGNNLDMIVAVFVGNRTAPITLQTQTLLEFQAPKQVIGYADLTLVYALGKIHFHNAIEIAEPGPKTIALATFWKHKISQRSGAALIKVWPSTVGANEVTCVARYSKNKERALALWRAKRTCASLQAARSTVRYSVAVARVAKMPQVELRIKY